MKHYIFLLWLLFPLTMLAQQPFAPIGAKWYDDSRNYQLPYVPRFFTLYESTGDTTIDGISLRQVGPFLLHQDSGRVSYWQGGALHLIYDFTVTVGDSVSFEFDDFSNTIFVGTVTQDTQIVIDGVSLRKWACELVYVDSVYGPEPVGTYHYAERIGVIGADWIWRAVVPYGPLVAYTTEGSFPYPRCYHDSTMSYTYPFFATYNLPCDYTQPVSIEQPATESWRVYPNPSRGQVRVAAPSGATARAHEVQVWDAQGRMVLRRPMQGEETALSLLGHVPGLYVLQVRAEGQVLHSQRLVLQ